MTFHYYSLFEMLKSLRHALPLEKGQYCAGSALRCKKNWNDYAPSHRPPINRAVKRNLITH